MDCQEVNMNTYTIVISKVLNLSMFNWQSKTNKIKTLILNLIKKKSTSFLLFKIFDLDFKKKKFSTKFNFNIWF